LAEVERGVYQGDPFRRMAQGKCSNVSSAINQGTLHAIAEPNGTGNKDLYALEGCNRKNRRKKMKIPPLLNESQILAPHNRKPWTGFQEWPQKTMTSKTL
jgi:hypothetical protein